MKQGWAAAWNRLLLYEKPDAGDVRDKHLRYIHSAEYRLIAPGRRINSAFEKASQWTVSWSTCIQSTLL
jgi:hypothetical protein